MFLIHLNNLKKIKKVKSDYQSSRLPRGYNTLYDDFQILLKQMPDIMLCLYYLPELKNSAQFPKTGK